ncbi:hypothetical protein DPMN_180885 [Dreissena polymorpha]|uniref:Uncharacterized protein n=1 Tax=Dreissena polymorpha TaxID=45954 RepID=A0A9D4DBA3_DREPO|nr:hypothetical protein DPMN_180885 [Dreissena polymorpha]
MHVQRPDAVIMSFVSDGKHVPFGSDVKLGTELNLLIHVINNDKGWSEFDRNPLIINRI